MSAHSAQIKSRLPFSLFIKRNFVFGERRCSPSAHRYTAALLRFSNFRVLPYFSVLSRVLAFRRSCLHTRSAYTWNNHGFLTFSPKTEFGAQPQILNLVKTLEKTPRLQRSLGRLFCSHQAFTQNYNLHRYTLVNDSRCEIIFAVLRSWRFSLLNRRAHDARGGESIVKGGGRVAVFVCSHACRAHSADSLHLQNREH